MAGVNNSPLAATLARLRAGVGLDADCGEMAADWFCASDLWAADTARLNDSLAKDIAAYPGAEWRIAGAFFIGHYVWYVAGAAVAAYLAENRVPDLTADNIALRHIHHTYEVADATYEYFALQPRFLSGRFAAAPADPEALNHAALILADKTALLNLMRLQLEEHVAPLISAIYNSTRLGKRTQWNLVADSCARLFQWYGLALGDEARGCAEGQAFIKAPGSPLARSATDFTTLEYAGQRETFCLRGSCCLSYRLPGGAKCDNCVLRDPMERDQLLIAQMASKHTAQATA